MNESDEKRILYVHYVGTPKDYRALNVYKIGIYLKNNREDLLVEAYDIKNKLIRYGVAYGYS